MEVETDELDQLVTQALQHDGRASFSRIAEVLGVSERTVARRYQRLRGARVLRVYGHCRPEVVGGTNWLLRIECMPDAAERIASALAARANTNWVRLTPGGTEIVCGLRADADDVLLTHLPRMQRVVGFTAHCVLNRFRGEDPQWHDWDERLSAEQSAAFPRPVAATGLPQLDDVDRAVLDVLVVDGRTSLADIAAQVGVSESAARRRVRDLRESGALHFEVEFEPRAFGRHTEAMLWLTVQPSALASTGDRLAEHPEIAYSAATSGRTSLVASVICRDVSAFYAYFTHRIGAIPEVAQAESTLYSRTVKRQRGG